MNKFIISIAVILAASGCAKKEQIEEVHNQALQIAAALAKEEEHSAKGHMQLEERLTQLSQALSTLSSKNAENMKRIDALEAGLRESHQEQVARWDRFRRESEDEGKKSVVVKDSLVGAVYLVKNSGDSSILRGQEISIISKKDAHKLLEGFENSPLTALAKSTEKLARSGSTTSAAYIRSFEIELSSSRTTLIAKTKSGIDGKYSIKGIPPGEYVILSVLKSTLNFGFWLVPVTIDSAKTITMDLDNSNLAHLYP